MNQVRLIKCLWYAKKIVKLCLGIYIFVKENKGNILCNVTVVRYLSWQPQEQRALFSSGSFGFQIECLCRLTRTTVDGDKTKSTRVVVGFMQLSEQRRTKKEKNIARLKNCRTWLAYLLEVFSERNCKETETVYRYTEETNEKQTKKVKTTEC